MENNDFFENKSYSPKIEAMRSAISQVIAGQERIIDLILTAIIADGHVLIEGVPGLAKTLSAKVISKLINAELSRIQFTSDLMPSDVLGTNVFNMGTNAFDFHKGPAFGDIIVVDEINRAPAKTQSALFELMEERQATIDGVRYPMGEIYTIIATQNPIEQEGTYRLPEAQLDRFLFKINMNYPSVEEEIRIITAHNQKRNFTQLEGIEPIISKEELLDLRSQAQQVFIDEKLIRYIAHIVQKSRITPSVYLGASPRASIALLNASKAFALLQGRSFVIPDDIQMLAVPVLCHRLLLSSQAEMEGTPVETIISDILKNVEVPK